MRKSTAIICVLLAATGICFIALGVYFATTPQSVQAQATVTPAATPEETATAAPVQESEPLLYRGETDGLVAGLRLRVYDDTAQSIKHSEIISSVAGGADDGRYVYAGYLRTTQAGKYSISCTAAHSFDICIGGYTLHGNGGENAFELELLRGYYELEITLAQAGDFAWNISYNGNAIKTEKDIFCQPFVSGIKQISFLREHNPALITDVSCSIGDGKITALLPPGVQLDKLAASFTAGGAVYAGDNEVKNGVIADFSKKRLKVVNDDGSTDTYYLSLRILDTGLPCIAINSEGKKAILSKTEYVPSTVEIVGNGAAYGNDLLETACNVKIRGNYSALLEKKPYTIKFDKKTAVLDLEKEKTWVLVASHLDLSQMRNMIAYELARSFDATEYSPRFRFVDVFVNGMYRGLYIMGDHVDISKNKLDLDDKSTDADIGCIFELETPARAEGTEGIDYFRTPQGWCVTYKDPDGNKLTKEQRIFLRDYFIAAENAIVSGENYEDYIDIDSFIDWYLVETFFKNCDSNFTSSIYFHRDKGGKLKMGPVWDFDSGTGNHIGFDYLLEPTGWEPRWGTYFENLMQYPEVRERMQARWWEKRDVFDGFFDYMDECAALIEKSYEENFKVWPVLRNGIWPVPNYVASRKSLDGQVGFIKEWLTERLAWLDEHFASTNF